VLIGIVQRICILVLYRSDTTCTYSEYLCHTTGQCLYSVSVEDGYKSKVPLSTTLLHTIL